MPRSLHGEQHQSGASRHALFDVRRKTGRIRCSVKPALRRVYWKQTGEDMQIRAHECYFSAAHAAKDSGIALALASSAGLTLPLAQAAYEQYERLVALGRGDLDKSGIAELTFKGRQE